MDINLYVFVLKMSNLITQSTLELYKNQLFCIQLLSYFYFQLPVVFQARQSLGC